MHDRDRKHGGSNSDLVATLLANHRAFLQFVERRVGSRDVAEEILQSAFAKNLEKLDAVRDTAVGWFYRVLRNAIIDHRRRAAAVERRLDAYARDDGATNARDNELHRVVCKCVGELAATLKPEYAASRSASAHRVPSSSVPGSSSWSALRSSCCMRSSI